MDAFNIYSLCSHTPSKPITMKGKIIHWRCKCGRIVKMCDISPPVVRTETRKEHLINCPSIYKFMKH